MSCAAAAEAVKLTSGVYCSGDEDEDDDDDFLDEYLADKAGE